MENIETQKELEWKEPVEIEDGKHTGTITRVEFRSDPYEYTDIYIKLDEADVELKYGCPTNLSENTKLGKLLIALGEKSEKGRKVRIDEVLKGKRVEFMTLVNKEGYARIVPDSIKAV